MANRRSTPGVPKPESHPETVQRTYRFGNGTLAAIDDDCTQNLSNSKRVIESLMLHWLDPSAEGRAATARMHCQRLGTGSPDLSIFVIF